MKVRKPHYGMKRCKPTEPSLTIKTHIHAPGLIRTRNPSKRAAVDLRLRPRGHCDRPPHTPYINISSDCTYAVPCNAVCLTTRGSSCQTLVFVRAARDGTVSVCGRMLPHDTQLQQIQWNPVITTSVYTTPRL
jgi:hypothetical protein